ncbi:MAG: hypothetical protein ACTHNZ_17190 [Trinickia sp.]|uniref:hypothetical protein n=1 Tax=Trinickia sp. TaxID=2571163 RepID=UPI003F817000
MPSNFDSKYQAALVADIRTMLFHTELSADATKIASFSNAGLGGSTYSFGVLQFDVGNNSAARIFLSSIGFKDDEIKGLSKQAPVTASALREYDARLKSHEDELQEFTDAQILGYVEKLSSVVDFVKSRNAAAAAAIQNSPDLQLSLVDYINQFGLSGLDDKKPTSNSMLAYLCGEPVNLRGGKLPVVNVPTVDDIQAYIDNTAYAQANARAADTRMSRYNMAIYEIASSSTSTFNTVNTAATPTVDLAQHQIEAPTPAPTVAARPTM